MGGVDPDVKTLFEEFKAFTDTMVARFEGGMRAVIRTLEVQSRSLESQTRAMERNTGRMVDELRAQREELKEHREALFLILDEIRGAQGSA
jgi:hypothetical protein